MTPTYRHISFHMEACRTYYSKNVLSLITSNSVKQICLAHISPLTPPQSSFRLPDKFLLFLGPGDQDFPSLLSLHLMTSSLQKTPCENFVPNDTKFHGCNTLTFLKGPKILSTSQYCKCGGVSISPLLLRFGPNLT